MSNSFDDFVTARFAKHARNTASPDELVSIIHPHIRFRRNSINLWIGKPGSGKTYGVALEFGKLSLLPNNGGYGMVLFVNDNGSDDTFEDVKKVLEQHMLVKHCSYDEAEQQIKEIVDRKDAYKQVKRYNLANRLTENSRENILGPLGCQDFNAKTSHSIVVFDDCMGILKQKKYVALLKGLFKSRHPNITYFILIQDPLGVPSEVKTNASSLVLFGKFPIQKIRYLANMMPGIVNSSEFWNKYHTLSDNDFIYIDIRDPHNPMEVCYRAGREYHQQLPSGEEIDEYEEFEEDEEVD
jgi:hypothetical protein